MFVTLKDASVEKIAKGLGEWGIDLEKFKAKVDQEMAEAKQDYYERLEKLSQEMDAVLRKFRPEPGGQIEAQLEEWRSELGQLIARAKEEKKEAKRLLDELGDRKKAAKEKLKEFKRSGDEAWVEVKSGLESAWAELRPALDRALAKFK
jgi:succinate dehydrogenase/fumarate reductase flavoprotein subunit